MARSMIARIQPAPGREVRLEQLIIELAGHVRQEAGNLAFLPYRHTAEPVRYEILEVYRDESAFQAHLAQPYVKAFNGALKEAAEGGASTVVDLDEVGPQAAPAGPGGIRGVDHIGLTVPDVDAASRFFEEAFGAVHVYDVLPKGSEPMAGEDVEAQLGLPKGSKIVHMRLMRVGDSATFELFGIAGAEQGDPTGLADFGLTHFGLYVDDIEAAASRFEKSGGTLLSPPHGLAGVEGAKGNAGLYGRAPWGTLVELLTYPDGIAYAADARAHRWTPPRPLAALAEEGVL